MMEVNREELDRLVAGESNAELMHKCIEIITEQFPEDTLPSLKDRICDLWANQLAGFYTESDTWAIDEHWNNNYQWGMDILDSYMEEVE